MIGVGSLKRMDLRMATPQQFRLYAQTCVQMADASGHPSPHRSQLLDMAQEWRRLADEAERFEQLVREVDQAFDIPSAKYAPAQRRSH
jgi:hypothetical protein